MAWARWPKFCEPRENSLAPILQCNLSAYHLVLLLLLLQQWWSCLKLLLDSELQRHGRSPLNIINMYRAEPTSNNKYNQREPNYAAHSWLSVVGRRRRRDE